jgi:hypothetical protein
MPPSHDITRPASTSTGFRASPVEPQPDHPAEPIEIADRPERLAFRGVDPIHMT